MNFILQNLEKIAGILSFLAYGMYIVSIVKGITKPSRSTWWVLTLVGGLILWSSMSLGLYESLWIQISYVVGPLVLAILSIKYGSGDGLSTLDKRCLIGAVIAGLLWIIFNSPLIGFTGSIIVDFIGLVPTIRKSYLNPKEEDPNAWGVEFIASILNASVITAWFQFSDKNWIYALYLLLANGSITILLWWPKIKTFITKKTSL